MTSFHLSVSFKSHLQPLSSSRFLQPRPRRRSASALVLEPSLERVGGGGNLHLLKGEGMESAQLEAGSLHPAG